MLILLPLQFIFKLKKKKMKRSPGPTNILAKKVFLHIVRYCIDCTNQPKDRIASLKSKLIQSQ